MFGVEGDVGGVRDLEVLNIEFAGLLRYWPRSL